MDLIPDKEFRERQQLNLAPMVDFLFLVVGIFAVLAVTRTAISDFDINLATLSTNNNEAVAPAKSVEYIINLSINDKGQYKWICDTQEYLMENLEAIQKEMVKQQMLGVIPKEKNNVKVLLHIDKTAQWEPIAEAIFAVREMGFQIHPVYEPKS